MQNAYKSGFAEYGHDSNLLRHYMPHVIKSMALIQRYLHNPPDQGDISREMYQCIIGKPSGQKGFVMLIDFLNQSLHHHSLVPGYLLLGSLLHSL